MKKLLSSKRISQTQARAIAYAAIGDIRNYCNEQKKEFLEFSNEDEAMQGSQKLKRRQ